MKNVFLASALTLSMMASQALVADSPALSEEQREQFHTIIHDYLVKHPEVLIEVSQALQQKQELAMQENIRKAFVENSDAILNEKTTVGGNPKGDVTLIEFFDYQCGHCKHVAPVISELAKDKNLRIIYKTFPIFGQSSEDAAKAVLAAAAQKKYEAMHEALLKNEGQLNADIINSTAESIGLDMTQFKKDINSQAVNDILEANKLLMGKLQLAGVPGIIIASTPDGKFKQGSEPSFVPGAASKEVLQDLIKKASLSK